MPCIFKYKLIAAKEQSVMLPKGALLLTVQTQAEEPHLWAIVDPSAPLEPRKIAIYATGEELPHEIYLSPYLGTFQLKGGALVFHAFDKT